VLQRRVWGVTAAALLVCLAGAAGEPAPAAETPKGGGSLIIVGGGSLPDSIRDRFIDLAGGARAQLVIIPTASSRAETGQLERLRSYTDWAPLATAGKVKSVYFLHTRRTEEANDPTFVKPLTEATGVWFSGGDQSLLTEAYKGTLVEKELRKVLLRGGVVGGTSAGAAVMSDLMICSGNPVAVVGEGFGFLPGVVVDQHFHERNRLARLVGVLTKHRDHLGIGIDEQTGVQVQGDVITVLGKENIHLCLPTSKGEKCEVKDFAAGDRLDLAELYRALATIPTPTTATSAKPMSSAATMH
jgi:cyanophycinase